MSVPWHSLPFSYCFMILHGLSTNNIVFFLLSRCAFILFNGIRLAVILPICSSGIEPPCSGHKMKGLVVRDDVS